MAQGNPPLVCIRDQTATVLARDAIATTLRNGNIPYEVLDISPIRISARSGKCSWMTVYSKPNGAAIPSTETRTAIRTILRVCPSNSKETMIGYTEIGAAEYVFIVWKHRNCSCTFFEIAGHEGNPPGTCVFIGGPEWLGIASTIHFKMNEFIVTMLKLPVVVPISNNCLSFITAACSNTFYWSFTIDPTIGELYCAAARVGLITLVLAGSNPAKIRKEMTDFLRYIEHDAAFVWTTIKFDRNEQVNIEDDIITNRDPPFDLRSLEDLHVPEKDDVQNLMEVFKRWRDDSKNFPHKRFKIPDSPPDDK